MKKFIAGLLCGVMVMSTTLVFAEQIDAIFGQVKLVVDGQPVDKETLLYNGTTYVPLRAVGEALGEDVNYDDATKTAYIGEMPSEVNVPVATETAKPTMKDPSSPKGSIDNPYGLNEPFIFHQEHGDAVIEVTFTEVYQGEEANKLALEYSSINVPATDKEYYLAKTNIKVKSAGDKNDPVSVISMMFDISGNNGVKYENDILHKFEYNADLYEGEEAELWLCAEVNENDDITLKISFGEAWFKLN